MSEVPAQEVKLPYGSFRTVEDLKDYWWSRFQD